MLVASIDIDEGHVDIISTLLQNKPKMDFEVIKIDPYIGTDWEGRRIDYKLANVIFVCDGEPKVIKNLNIIKDKVKNVKKDLKDLNKSLKEDCRDIVLMTEPVVELLVV